MDQPQDLHMQSPEELKGESFLRHGEHIELDPDHAAYLISRHGTTELDPLPSANPLDPLNWPEWRKNVYLGIFGLHATMAGFLAAGLVPATEAMSVEYGKSPTVISYLVSAQILCYGISPFFWLPIMQRIGRRPSLLISILGASAFNLGGAYCTTYGQQMATRCLTALFVSPPCALGGIVVTELFFYHQRGAKIGWWKLMFTVGAPGGPFIMGFVATHAGIRWIYYIFAIVTFSIFLAYLFFGPETLFDRTQIANQTHHTRGNQKISFLESIKLHKPTSKPFSLIEYLRPLSVFATFRLIAPICVYAIVFAYANIAIIITLPAVMGVKFGLNAQGIGLQFIAMIIGLVLGEIVGGYGSDRWMRFMTVRRGGQRVIEDRLWLAYPGFVCVVTGLVVWGVQTQLATPLEWNVTPDIGAAIASFGCQLLTTVLVTYAIDVDPKRAAQTGLVVSLVRQTWGFIGPFYFTDMWNTLNFGGGAGLMAGIVAVCGTVPVLLLQFTRIGFGARHVAQSEL